MYSYIFYNLEELKYSPAYLSSGKIVRLMKEKAAILSINVYFHQVVDYGFTITNLATPCNNGKYFKVKSVRIILEISHDFLSTLNLICKRYWKET